MLVLTYVFTGESDLDSGERHLALSVLRDLKPPDRVVSGGAYGLDTLVAVEGPILWPDAEHEICVPAAPFNGSAAGAVLDAGGRLFRAPEKRNPSASYMARNDLMIERAVAEGGEIACHAFPRTATRLTRSGTWSTVRRAEAAEVALYIHPLT